MPGLVYYRSLKKVERRFYGKHAKFVGLMENNIIKKAYHTEHRNIFDHEVYILRRVQGLQFVPKLLMVDNDKRVIYMSYCGRQIKNLEKHKHKIKKYQQILEKDYGIYHNDVKIDNICINKGQIYFIDFGWAREFKGIGGYGEGKIGDPKIKIPLTKKQIMDELKKFYLNDEPDITEFKLKIKDWFIKDNDPIIEIKQELKQDLKEITKIIEDNPEVAKDTIKVNNETTEISKDTIEVTKDTIEIAENTNEVNEDTIEVSENTNEVNEETTQIEEDISKVKEVVTKDTAEIARDSKQEIIEVKEESKEIKEIKEEEEANENNDKDLDIELDVVKINNESISESVDNNKHNVEISFKNIRIVADTTNNPYLWRNN
tara:strand:- start:8217 stop:9338 length:1122 start_codon:yes stop_codon:yes gene_type:complete